MYFLVLPDPVQGPFRLGIRRFIPIAACLSMLLFAQGRLNAQTYQPTWDSIDERPTPTWFTDAKFGIIIHWGVYSVPAYAPVIPGKLAYAEWYWHQKDEGRDNPKANAVETGTWDYHKKTYGADFVYKNFVPDFKAQLFDPDQWAGLFQRSGAKYIVLTSKHHEGFALWPSKEASATWGRPWNSVEAGPKRDLLGDLTDAVRAKGLRMGFYYSLYEWYNPLWLKDKPRYVSEHMFPQFKDAVTRYKPSIIYTDGEWEMTSAQWRSPELVAWLLNESPVKDEVAINDRWGSETRHKHGGYWTTEYTSGMSGAEHTWEESRGMGYSFGYNRAETLNDYHTGRELVIMLVDIVSRGGNFLLDIGPKADGTIPVIMQERLEQIGGWLKVNGDAIYGTRPWKETRQWSAGEQPKINYNAEFETAYDVAKLSAKPEPGKAAIEAFFTSKGNDVFAILPRWQSGSFLLKDVTGVKSVTLIGTETQLKFKSTSAGTDVALPDLPGDLRQQPAWVLKLSH
jgi:alpha-L-fucosidase